MTPIEQKFWKPCEPRQRPITTRKRRHDEQDEDRRLHRRLSHQARLTSHGQELGFAKLWGPDARRLRRRRTCCSAVRHARRYGFGIRELIGRKENTSEGHTKNIRDRRAVVIRIGRKKIIDMSLPRGSSISVAEQK